RRRCVPSSRLPLALLVTLVLADHQYVAIAAYDLALLAHRLDRRSSLHDPLRRLGSGARALAAVAAAATGSWRCSRARKRPRPRAGLPILASSVWAGGPRRAHREQPRERGESLREPSQPALATPCAIGSAEASAPRCHGVRILGPSPVIATVNSKCAAGEPSWEKIAQPSPPIRTAGRPAVVIGSIARTMPPSSSGPFPGFP